MGFWDRLLGRSAIQETMISCLSSQGIGAEYPTIWGLNPLDLHDRYWASMGVHVVRMGERRQLPKAGLFLLTSGDRLLLFRLRRLSRMRTWVGRRVHFLRLSDERTNGCREVAVTDSRLQLRSLRRVYDRASSRYTHVALTTSPRLARLWQEAQDRRSGLQELLRRLPDPERKASTTAGRAYLVSSRQEVMQFARDLVETWERPDRTVARARNLSGQVWADTASQVHEDVRFAGPVWIGAGRRMEAAQGVAGPAIVWDDPACRPPPGEFQRRRVGSRTRKRASTRTNGAGRKEPASTRTNGAGRKEPASTRTNGAGRKESASTRTNGAGRKRPRGYVGKRAIDIACALLGLALTLPFYPIIIYIIFREDGRPFFFGHRRESFGGREFSCLKFRTMRRDAEEIKAKLQEQNQVDGPQFYIEKDPRLLRVGPFLRKTKLDEIPQFINVLLGHMSLVGPRPSPFEENQYCPDWREARLSVRPGITGMWQVRRTRDKETDFQEWIKYDIEYVENVSWRTDLWILWRTFFAVVRGN